LYELPAFFIDFDRQKEAVRLLRKVIFSKGEFDKKDMISLVLEIPPKTLFFRRYYMCFRTQSFINIL